MHFFTVLVLVPDIYINDIETSNFYIRNTWGRINFFRCNRGKYYILSEILGSLKTV